MTREEIKKILEESPLFHIIPPEDIEMLIDRFISTLGPAPEYENGVS